MESRDQQGQVICVLRGYTVTEVLEQRADETILAGYCISGPNAASQVVYPRAEDAMRAIDLLIDGPG